MSSQHQIRAGHFVCVATTGFVAALCVSSPALASESFRCGGHVVEAGMTLERVQEYCGEPTEKSGDRWIYDRGPEQLVIVLHIQPDNTVGSIEARPRN